MVKTFVALLGTYLTLKLIQYAVGGQPGYRDVDPTLREQLLRGEPILFAVAFALSVPAALWSNWYFHRLYTRGLGASTDCYGKLRALNELPAVSRSFDPYTIFDRVGWASKQPGSRETGWGSNPPSSARRLPTERVCFPPDMLPSPARATAERSRARRRRLNAASFPICDRGCPPRPKTCGQNVRESEMITITGLSHVYANGKRALDSVTLSIPAGMFGLLGPTGAGKSTLMRAIATLQTPTSGSITFDEIDALKQPEALRRILGYLPQEFGVYPRISAYAMLDHLAVLKGLANSTERKEVVEALLHRVDLWRVRNRALAGLSRDLRQRFGIAQALIGNPRLIIVDAPTAGLDPAERSRLVSLLAAIGETVGVVLATPIVEDVTDLCTRMAVLANGRIVLEGAPQQLVAPMRRHIGEHVIDCAALGAHAASPRPRWNRRRPHIARAAAA
jgi:ABC-type multidrug transport system ATPase subunit